MTAACALSTCSHVRPGRIWAHGRVGASRPTGGSLSVQRPARPSPSVTMPALFPKPCDLCLSGPLPSRQFTDV